MVLHDDVALQGPELGHDLLYVPDWELDLHGIGVGPAILVHPPHELVSEVGGGREFAILTKAVDRLWPNEKTNDEILSEEIASQTI